MRTPLIALAIAVTTLSFSEAHAKDLGNRFGIGGARNTLGQQGLALKYWVGHLGFGMVFGGTSVGQKATGKTNDGSDYTGTDTTTHIDSSLRVLFNAARAKDVNMYVGGGIGLGYVSTNNANPDLDDPSTNEIGFELFFGTEYFLSNHFAIQAEVGIPIRPSIGEDGPALSHPHAEGEGQAFGFFHPATWGAGFNFYF